MNTLDHPDYEIELKKLEFTLEYLKKYNEYIHVQKEKIDKEVDYGIRHFSSDNSQQYIDLTINTTLQKGISQKLVNIEKSLSKPYFARVDFAEENSNNAEKLYIGKMSLMDEEHNHQIIIVDWRAPISNLYYEGRLGGSSYICPDGKIDGEILLKRQYSIENGKLENIFDIDITTNDEFLQSYLGANAENRLKDIVSTIQVEQNKIIRADMWHPLIVQGAAGSGKTTIALHRIAYLIYTYEKSFKPENFMIIAPNRFFLSYISEVLPELGVEKVKQTTFEDFSMELLGSKFKLRESHQKLSSIINAGSSIYDMELKKLVKKASEFKSSMEFKSALDNYMALIENNFIPHEDFKVGSFTLFKYDELCHLFFKEYKSLPMMKRIDEIKKHLTGRIKLKRDSMVEKLQFECDRKIKLLKENMEISDERHRLIVKAIDYKDSAIANIQSNSKVAVKNYISKITPLQPFKYYRNLLENEELFRKITENYIDKKTADFIMKYSLEVFDSGYIEHEDLAPLVYLKYLIYGMDEKTQVRHAVIDEAQDFSVFQLYVLKKIIKDSSFTILGDLCQGIHSYRGIKDWNDLSKYVFEESGSTLLTLEQSYRTTVEIMEAANSVIKALKDSKLPLSKPVIRHGKMVEVIEKNELREVAEEIKKRINQMDENGFKSLAIICKTMDECIEMKALLKGASKAPALLSGKEKEYKGGVVIVPSYLSKGLEFDEVIIANAGKNIYGEDELDVKLLYVAMTRPLHVLNIFSIGECTPLLNELKAKSKE